MLELTPSVDPIRGPQTPSVDPIRADPRSDHELPWKRILIDVADNLNPGVGWTDFRMDDGRAEEAI